MQEKPARGETVGNTQMMSKVKIDQLTSISHNGQIILVNSGSDQTSQQDKTFNSLKLGTVLFNARKRSHSSLQSNNLQVQGKKKPDLYSSREVNQGLLIQDQLSPPRHDTVENIQTNNPVSGTEQPEPNQKTQTNLGGESKGLQRDQSILSDTLIDDKSRVAKRSNSFSYTFRLIEAINHANQKEEYLKQQQKDGKQIILISDAQFQMLQDLKRDGATDSTLSDDEKQLNMYEPLYAHRLAKASKRYAIIQNQRQKQEQLQRKRDQDQHKLIDVFLTNIDTDFQIKTRSKDCQEPKRKYFRQPKIYQNDYIIDLQTQECIFDFKSHIDPDNKHYKMLYLFVNQKGQISLLLGREKISGSKNSSSLEESSNESQISKTSSQLANEKEQDDDSPYFVKIVLDSIFLSYLEEPSLVSPSEIAGRTDVMLENEIFKEIVRKEFKNMFGDSSPQKQDNKKKDDEETIFQMNIVNLDDDYSPIKMGGVIEPHRKNFQDTIQEESSEINSQGNKKPKDVPDQPYRESRDFVLQLAPTGEQKKGESSNKMQESESKRLEEEGTPHKESLNTPSRRRTDVDGSVATHNIAQKGGIGLDSLFVKQKQHTMEIPKMGLGVANREKDTHRFQKEDDNSVKKFEQEMDKFVGSFSIVLNFNS